MIRSAPMRSARFTGPGVHQPPDVLRESSPCCLEGHAREIMTAGRRRVVSKGSILDMISNNREVSQTGHYSPRSSFKQVRKHLRSFLASGREGGVDTRLPWSMPCTDRLTRVLSTRQQTIHGGAQRLFQRDERYI